MTHESHSWTIRKLMSFLWRHRREEGRNTPEHPGAAYIDRKFTWRVHNGRKPSLTVHTSQTYANSTPLGRKRGQKRVKRVRKCKTRHYLMWNSKQALEIGAMSYICKRHFLGVLFLAAVAAHHFIWRHSVGTWPLNHSKYHIVAKPIRMDAGKLIRLQFRARNVSLLDGFHSNTRRWG